MKTKTKRILGQPSWRAVASDVELWLTQTGGHLGPVVFDRRGRKLQPFSVAPWAEERTDPAMPAILKVLRGDFFCMPFGANARPFRGERHPVHGETANLPWTLKAIERRAGQTRLHTTLKTRVRPGRVDKIVTLVDGHQAVYCRHVLSETKGPMSFGHHAMLRFPDPAGSGLIATSRFVHGQVFPEAFEKPEARGYSILRAGAEFQALDRVPTLTGDFADVSRYPARSGFEDLVMLVSDPQASLAWTAVTFPRERYVWFALKDPRVLMGTLFWISNGGRHYPPWNSRHLGVMGLEEITSYFHLGLAESARPNALSARGYSTCVELDPARPLTINYIMAVARVPAGFDRMAAIDANARRDAVTLRSQSGKSVVAPLDTAFLHGTETGEG